MKIKHLNGAYFRAIMCNNDVKYVKADISISKKSNYV